MQNNNRVLNFELLYKSCFCVCLYAPTSKSSLLYIEVWKIRWKVVCTKKRVVWSLLKITNDLLPDIVTVLWMINFKCIPSLKEHFCRQSCYSCLVAETRVEEVVVQFVQLSFVNALDRRRIQCFQISSQGPLLHSFSLLQCLGVIKSITQPLKL